MYPEAKSKFIHFLPHQAAALNARQNSTLHSRTSELQIVYIRLAEQIWIGMVQFCRQMFGMMQRFILFKSVQWFKRYEAICAKKWIFARFSIVNIKTDFGFISHSPQVSTIHIDQG